MEHGGETRAQMAETNGKHAIRHVFFVVRC